MNLKMKGSMVEAIKIIPKSEWHQWFEEKVSEVSREVETTSPDRVAELQGKIKGIRLMQNLFETNFGE